MKRTILMLVIFGCSFAAFSQGNGIKYNSELEFLNSWYGVDAINKFRATIDRGLTFDCEECGKLKGVEGLPKSQKLLNEKYKDAGDLFKKSFCLLPRYFQIKKDGTYIYMINFIDLGLTVPAFYDPKDVCIGVVEKLEDVFYTICAVIDNTSKKEISSIGFSIVYTQEGKNYDKPNVVSFSTRKKNIMDYYEGLITLKQLIDKLTIYHTSDILFKKIQ